MNKIFKVVWSKVKHCYVVVSEVAKNVITGSVKSAKIGGTPMTRGLALGAMMAFVITGNAWAEYNNYELPSGEFSRTSEVASNSTLDNGKNAIINSDYKLYSNPNAFSESKPNKLEMSGEIIYEGSNRLFNVYSGFAYNKSTVGEADNNLLIIKYDLTSNISSELYGALLAYEAKYDENNYEKYDEFVDDLTISGNKVKIDSVTLKSTSDNQYFMVNAAIAQGAANNNIKAKENSIEIENVIFYTDNVWIAGAQSRGGASLEGNQVKIKNTDIEKGYIAGAVGQNNATLQINENVVTIDGTSKIGCDVYGGYNMSGTASGNSINIKGDADISKASLYGDNGGEGIGNTLNLETGWNGVVGSAENFNIINVGEGVEAIFKAPIVANEQNTVINIGKDDGEDVDEEGVKESLLIGQIVTEETGSSSLNFINGGAWKVTGKSSVSDLQGDTVTINVDKVEENLVTITNGVKDNQKVVLNVTGDDIGVDVTTGVQTMVDTVVDGNGKSVFEKITDEEIDLKATVDATIAEDGSVQNVTTSIKPGDKFVVESDVAVSGGLNAADDKFTVDSETGDVIANDVFANGGNGVLVGLRETAEKTEVNRIAIEAEVDRATKAEAALQEEIAQSKADIATNAADIAQNTSDIQANRDTIDAVQTATNQNAADIIQNKADIAANANQIQANAGAIVQERAERAQADQELRDTISKEVQARQEADADLSAAIDAEAVAREAADADLSAAIEQNAQDIENETADREAADKKLQANIDKESVDRQIADAQERAERAQADQALKAEIDANAADIAQNKADIAANAADIAQNKADIAANAADIAQNKADIAANAADIAQNTSDIQANRDAIDAVQTATNQNAADIIQNKADIAANANQIQANAGAIVQERAERAQADQELRDTIIEEAQARQEADADLSAAIDAEAVAREAADADLSAAIEQNAQDIENETADREAADKKLQANIDKESVDRQIADAQERAERAQADQALKAEIDANAADIAQNKADIAANAADIAQNKADIAANAADIAQNKADIAANAADIAQNKADIAANAADIAQNTSDIQANRDAIDAVQTATNQNAADIIQNKADIAVNANQIQANAGAIVQERAERAQADQELRDTIIEEAQARQEADADLSAAIDAEAVAREAADADLSAAIEQNAQDIENETADREAADKKLQANIDKESVDRQIADAQERAERVQADQALKANIDLEAQTRETADNVLSGRIDDEITNRANADEALNNRITAEETERIKADLILAGNDIASGSIDHESGTITLTRNNGTEFELEGVLCDSRLDAVSYDAKTGKMIFTIKDHYNQDKDNSIVVEDIASKAALDKEISDRILADDIERQERIDGDNMLNSKLNQLGSKVNKVGAGAAALAALHPLDFDPDDKLSFSAGVGNYGGETATALGAFYRPNEKVMISAAGTMGNGENMVNMGVSFALDKTNNVSNSRTAMAREIVDLRAHVARQEQALARQDQQIAQLVAMVNQLTGNTMSYEVNKDIIFPDVPENHWAYEYIHSLAAKGIIEGYPDGNFDGDRTMTRYEFATMLYKAMQKGTVLNEQIRQEFSAELGRIRVDRIKGADSDTNKIERVRVNADVDRDDYGSK